MSALVISVTTYRESNATAGQEFVSVLETPPIPPTIPASLTPLRARPTDEPYAKLTGGHARIVKDCGEALCKELSANERIAYSLAVMAGQPHVATPVLVKLESPITENLPWEALYDQACDFLALQPRWPIARLSSSSQLPTPTDRIVEPAIRILAVLAAVGVDARGEWDRLWSALAPFGDRVRVHVILCQDDLADSIENLGDARVTTEMLSSSSSIRRRVFTFSPNIIHFFCHGTAEPEPRLELALPVDYDGGAAEGEVKLMSAQLGELVMTPSVWVVTLNCCKGARGSASARSIAGNIAEIGVPTVVAMRENVDARDANIFTGLFYEHAMNRLGPILPNDQQARAGAEITVPEDVWLDAMHPPRDVLSKRNGHLPADQHEWTLPVIYLRRGGLRLKSQPRSDATDLAARVLPPPAVAAAPSVDEGPPGDPVIAPAVKLRSKLQELQAVRLRFAASGVPQSGLDIIDAQIRTIEADLLSAELAALRSARAYLAAAGNSDPDVVARFDTHIAEYERRLRELGVG